MWLYSWVLSFAVASLSLLDVIETLVGSLSWLWSFSPPIHSTKHNSRWYGGVVFTRFESTVSLFQLKQLISADFALFLYALIIIFYDMYKMGMKVAIYTFSYEEKHFFSTIYILLNFEFFYLLILLTQTLIYYTFAFHKEHF